MKKLIMYINTFIMFFILICYIFLIYFEINLRPNNIIKQLDSINYYQKAYSNVLKNFDDIIVNNDLKEELMEFYNLEYVKKDVNLIVRGNSVNHYDQIKNIVSKYSKDDKIIDKYSNDINSIINNNIFMVNDYHELNKVYINIYDCLFITIIFILIEFIFIAINYFLVKGLYFIKILLLSSSIFVSIPKLFISISGIFNNFVYGNKYFSELIITFINNYCNDLFILSIVGVTFIICLKDYSNKYY